MKGNYIVSKWLFWLMAVNVVLNLIISTRIISPSMKAYNPNTGEWESDPNLKPLFPTPSTEDNNGISPKEALKIIKDHGSLPTPPTQGRMGGAGERVTLPTPPNPTNAGGNGFHKRNGEEVTHLTVPTPNPTSDTSLKAILESAKSIFKNPKLEVFEVPAPTSDSEDCPCLIARNFHLRSKQRESQRPSDSAGKKRTLKEAREMALAYLARHEEEWRKYLQDESNVETKRNTTPAVSSSSNKELPSDSAVEELRQQIITILKYGMVKQEDMSKREEILANGIIDAVQNALTLSTQRGAEKERERIKAKSQTHDASPDSAIGSEIWYHIKETDLNPPKEI